MTALTGRVRRLGFAHLADISDGRGVFEHARHDVPRHEHGYCLDDVARAFVVTIRAKRPTPVVQQLTETYLRFIEEAVGANGSAHNRMNTAGVWTDEPAMGDWWGRAVGAAGAGTRYAPTLALRVRANRVFTRAGAQTPRDTRTAAYAVLGAAELLACRPASASARNVLTAALAVLPDTAAPGWNWPEPRMRYANATLAEALLAAGHVRRDRQLVDRALGFLGFLLESETRDGHLSVTGSGGRSPEDTGPFFDQQSIEVAAMADACARAFGLTGDQSWYAGVRMSWDWFEGRNDVGLPMVDAGTGAGYDGLEAGGRNENRGAESTLAALSTFQRAEELGIVGGR